MYTVQRSIRIAGLLVIGLSVVLCSLNLPALKIRSPLSWPRLAVSSPLARQQYRQPGRDHIPRPMLREIGSLSAMHSRCPSQGRASSPDSAPESTGADSARAAQPHPAPSRWRVLQFPAAMARQQDFRKPATAARALPAALVLRHV